MVIKHYDIKNGDCFFCGERVQIYRLQLTESAEAKARYKKTAEVAEKDNQKIVSSPDGTSGENSEILSFFTQRILEMLKNTWVSDLFFYVNDLTTLSNCEVIVAVTQDSVTSERIGYVFNECVYLMTDKGKTIERII